MKNPLSYSSVRLDLFSRDGVPLTTASGFIVEADNKYYLVTNRRVVSGKHSLEAEQQPEIAPHILKTFLHIFRVDTYEGKKMRSSPLLWVGKKVTIQLYDNQNAPRWIAIRGNNKDLPSADVIALPIDSFKTLASQSIDKLRPFVDKQFPRTNVGWSFSTKISAIPISAIDTDAEYGPSDLVHVIGYPVGWAPAGPDKSNAAFWRTGRIVSEMNEPGMILANGFFVDPPAPEGMTGSPVVGTKNDCVKLLGVYSDHSTEGFGANAGLVCGASLVKDLITTH